MKAQNTQNTHDQVATDFKHAVLAVSVLTNVFVLITVLVAQASNEYAAQLVSIL